MTSYPDLSQGSPGSGPELKSPDELLADLDPEQRQVARQVSGPLCVLAGAGTGKTRAITYRIAYGVATEAFAPTSLLAVTFTARAAGEMRERLAALGVHGVQARTFHAAALRQLSFFWPTVVGGNFPPLVKQKGNLVAAAAHDEGIDVDRVAIRDLAAEVEWAKVSMITPEQYVDAAVQADRIPPTNMSPETVSSILRRYEAVKSDNGVIDFEDVLLMTVGMLQQRPDIAKRIRSQYRNFVVDEYQDVSKLQQQLLDLWLGERNDLCVVGDVAQTIYSFTGATPHYLSSFAQRYEGARTVVLNRDYRSSPEIVTVANRILVSSPGGMMQGAVQLKSHAPSGPKPSFSTFHDDETEAEQVAEQIKELYEDGLPLSQIAVLFRTNAQSQAIEQALTAAGIGYVMRGGEEFFHRGDVRAAITAFQNLANSEADGDTATFMRESVRGAGWTETAPETQGAVRERWDALNALYTLAKDRAAEGVHPDALAKELKERMQAQHAPTVEGVTLSTIHAAKGLEWEAVFLIGVREGLLPISMAKTEAAIAEERRLFYVAVTRARSILRISYAQSRSGGRGKNKRSHFLAPLWPERTKSSSTPSASASPRERARMAARQFEEDASTDSLERFTQLKAWRRKLSDEMSKPAFTIFADVTLREIALEDPQTLTQLGQLRGIGDTKLSLWGEEVLDLLAELRGDK
ncbi:ATP-dependent DNA helicase UvrD2 [Boudabousia marimammalium]|uniref:DNA 3'-5' helicase n=1 Tax=Boudabousia marimammalium TaxID=156892 RepID=A0A1Q5PLZ5_9ACTO|nr:ATP-dependent DNA helicase UvrD2 [Boudabousia marimammalium]OKL48069.1 ATP-dependent DNA helicase [Boudabousia marimammalium]